MAGSRRAGSVRPDPATGVGTAPVRPAPAAPGGPNRRVRKEEARKERRRLERRAARRRVLRRLGVVLAPLILAGAVAGSIVLRETPAEAAGCAPVRTVPAYGGATASDNFTLGVHVQETPALSTYPSIPPTSGPHAAETLPAGVYQEPPDVYRAIHSLQRGAVVIWHAPGAAGSPGLREIAAAYREEPANDHVIVAPYRYPDAGTAGALPSGRRMVLVAWHRMQVCEQPSLDVAREFIRDYRFDPARPQDYRGDAPETGATI